MKKLLSILLTMAMVLSLGVTAFAEEQTKEEEALVSYLNELTEKGELQDSDVETLLNLVGDIIQAEANKENALPVRFDLRDNDVVTPIRTQEPWGSCWAFGSIAAAETSILSMLKEKGEAIDPKTFDLSEKHLIWFGTNPITEAINPEQVGEGMYITGKDDNSYTSSIYGNGGYGLNTSTLFASGVGPVLEKYFPYQGSSGLTDYEYVMQDDRYIDLATEFGLATLGQDSLEDVLNNLDDPMTGMLLNFMKVSGYLEKEIDENLTVDDLRQA
ncbi:MAG: hypothetical protein II008_14265, partial [Oscillospiraceae bacterium]|nr:hypothetical protein [Oscillospiraceae bacterium]